jgi:hypothetical protein
MLQIQLDLLNPTPWTERIQDGLVESAPILETAVEATNMNEIVVAI